MRPAVAAPPPVAAVPPPRVPPRQATAVSPAPPSSLPKYLMYGSPAAVGIAAFIVGARFATMSRQPAPTEVTQTATPAPTPAQQPPVEQPGGQTPTNNSQPRTNSGLVNPTAGGGFGTRPGETIPPPNVQPPPRDGAGRTDPPRPTTIVQPAATPAASAREKNLA